MKILSWNVRGLNASDKRSRIKNRLDSSFWDIVLLQETKLSLDNFSATLGKWTSWKHSFLPSNGASGGLATLWKGKSVSIFPLQSGTNWKLLSVKHFSLNFFLINLYGPTTLPTKF